ncbi:DUF1194 domain-containing protein [Synechococcus sp. BO 8801]|uniref:DUF1194 domain-containing protein n=1 Tax=Synechococcus sp. BO 8801 TaxID=169670 RepID=UPI000B98B914|nr:DUF1194 domain-containing protein [Synechococcus sp. BO 8801]
MRSTLKPLLRGGAAAAAVAIGLFGTSQPAHAVTNVFQELFLSLDVSGSINSSEFALYKGGYVSAFQDAAVQAKIAETFAFGRGGLAIAVGQWSEVAAPTLAIDWKHITDLTTDGINGGTSLNSFITALQGMGRQGGIGSSTCIDCGMLAAITAINTNAFETTRASGRVIDISTDGVGNVDACGPGVNEAQCAQTRRAQAVASGIIINGLGVGNTASGFLTANVATPANGDTKAGFVETANDFDTFETAITNKLIREVGPGPEDSVPGPLPVLGAAAAFGFSRKLRRRIHTANLHQA